MTQKVQELINKIKSEGFQEAQSKAREIENEAKRKADAIVQEANRKAQEMVNEAQQESRKIKESTQMALQQASRDMLLNLRREIGAVLMKILHGDIHKALSAEQLAEIISLTIKGYMQQDSNGKDVKVVLSEKDAKKLKEGFMAKLKDQIKHPIHLESSAEVTGGFTISFDNGRSCFDFTDASLVEYLGSLLNEEISALLKSSMTSQPIKK